MEIEIVSDVRNELMERREVEAVISFEGPTPSRNEILAEVSKKLGVPDTHINVEKIWQRFGRQEARVLAFVYDTPIREKSIAQEEKPKEDQEGKAEEEEQKDASTSEAEAKEEKKEENAETGSAESEQKE